jgi:hypothetical protein
MLIYLSIFIISCKKSSTAIVNKGINDSMNFLNLENSIFTQIIFRRRKKSTRSIILEGKGECQGAHFPHVKWPYIRSVRNEFH